MERPKPVEIRFLTHFLDSLTKEMRKEFYQKLGRIEIKVEKIHEPYEIPVASKAFAGKFHQFFVQKVICNLQDKDWCECDVFSRFANIFPFKIKHDIQQEANLEIHEMLDFNFKNNIKVFLKKHIIRDYCDEDVDELIKLFIKNINFYKTTNDISEDHRIVKLTDEGIQEYLRLYKWTREAMQVFSPDQEKTINFDIYDDDYFRHIGSTNFEDLFSLLEVNFYRLNPQRYQEVFGKFLYFFTTASCRENEDPTSLFFIDDLLFECLKSLRVFVKTREDPITLKSHIGNLTCVQQRIHIGWFAREKQDMIVSDKSLNDIKNFFETGIRGIQEAEMNCFINEPLQSQVFACTRHEVIEVCFSKLLKDNCRFFMHGIIFSAFSQKFFNRICIYNLYTGIKTWMYTPSCKEEILEFVRKYHVKPNDDVDDGYQFWEHCIVDFEKYYVKPCSNFDCV